MNDILIPLEEKQKQNWTFFHNVHLNMTKKILEILKGQQK